MKLSQFFARKPLVMNLVMLFVVLLALASTTQIKRLGFPRVDLGVLAITTIYPGASPEDVELNVTVKLEESLKEIDGIDEFTSTSLENRSEIHVKIDQDAEDFEKVKDEIRRAIETVSDLPSEVENSIIFERKVDNFPIYEVALFHKNNQGSRRRPLPPSETRLPRLL